MKVLVKRMEQKVKRKWEYFEVEMDIVDPDSAGRDPWWLTPVWAHSMYRKMHSDIKMTGDDSKSLSFSLRRRKCGY